MKKIYISGPYTKGDPSINTHNAVMVANKIMDAGHVCFLPHLFHFWHVMTPRPYDDWMKIDLAFLPDCDCILRLPGESKGADIEVAKAKELGMPVYNSVEELLESEK